jgi:four helix bundle protein
MKIYSFEKLICWQKAKELSKWIYKLTLNFPPEEKFGIVSQMRRASISIASNIAEGTSRKTKKDQAKFSVIAYSSTIELLNDLIIVFELNFITKEEYDIGRNLIEEVTKLISSLHKSQQELNP